MTGTLDRIRVTKGALTPGQFDIPMALAARRLGSSIELSWPLQVGAVIPQSGSVLLPTGTLWGDVTSTLITNGTRVSTSLGLGTGPEFYRLRRAP